MSFFEGILRAMDSKMITPELYGWFHLLWLGITIGTAVALCLWHKKKPADRERKITLAVSVTVLLLEVYKQINYSFSYEDGISFFYQWYAFPFQFCSTPMYIGLLAGLLKKGKIADALYAYLATFSVFAGVCVMLYPGDVFVDTIGINIQTMICHGAMVVLGVYLFYTGHVKTDSRTILKAALVFAVCVALASVMNEIAHATGLLKREVFNMFFISPYCAPSLPVYSLVQGVVPFPLSLVLYILGFTAAAEIILLLAKGVQTVSHKKVLE